MTTCPKNLRKYVEHKQEGNLELAQLYLDHSLWQVLYGSNSKQVNGLQDRRNAEALLSNTYDRRIAQSRGTDQIDKEIFDCFKNQIRNTLDEIKEKYQVKLQEFAPYLQRIADSHARLHESLILHNTGKMHYFNDRYLIEQMSKEFVFNYNACFANICDSTADRMCSALEKAAACGKPLPALEEIAMIDYQKLKGKFSRMFDFLCNSWHGQLTQYRHSATGVTHYIWRTCGDGRVRSSHSTRDGQVFSWNHVHDDGHPGQPYNCRCWAEPVAAERIARSD